MNSIPSSASSDHSIFEIESSLIIQTASTMYLGAVTAQKDLTQLFFDTIAFFAIKRNEIAVAAKDPNPHHFGQRRDDPKGNGHLSLITFLSQKDYMSAQRELEPLVSSKGSIMCDKQVLKMQDRPVITATVIEKRSSYNQFDYYHSLLKDSWYLSDIEAKQLLSEYPPESSTLPSINHFKTLVADRSLNERLRREKPDFYQKIKIRDITTIINERFNKEREKENIQWLVITPRIEINNSMYALSKLYSRTYKVTFVGEKKNIMDTTIVHQDSFLNQKTLEEIAVVFKRTLEYKREDTQKITHDVALIHYLFAQCTPYLRGSASIGEWLEKSIYHFHGYNVAENKWVNLKALSTTWDLFFKFYIAHTTLTKISSVEPISASAAVLSTSP